MNKPNIFHGVICEVSQDAFMFWLLAWSDPEALNINAELHKLSHKLLGSFFAKHDREFPSPIKKIDICGGYRNIDILLRINDSIVIPIKDNIFNRGNPGQLIKYIQYLKEDGYAEQNILPIYLQIKSQGNFKRLREMRFMPFSRKDLLGVLSLGKDIKNDILHDYIEYLEEIESAMQRFLHRSLDQWDILFSWQGFYNYLQNELGDGEWDILSNASNSFLGFWWRWHNDEDCAQYLQLERVYGNPELCFKIRVNNKKRQTSLKWKWCHRFLQASEGSPIKVVKPVYHNNNDITVAVVDGDYRKTDKDGKIDLNKTLDVIKVAQNIYDKAMKDVR